MGPVISKKAMIAIQNHYHTLISTGATVLCPLKTPKQKGFFLSPALMEASAIKIPDSECFGPLLCIKQVSSFDDAITEANATNYGLSASLISESASEFKKFFKQIHAGIINWNRPTNGASSLLPFGGVGYSGNYRAAGFFTADYCSYPIASLQQNSL